MHKLKKSIKYGLKMALVTALLTLFIFVSIGIGIALLTFVSEYSAALGMVVTSIFFTFAFTLFIVSTIDYFM